MHNVAMKSETPNPSWSSSFPAAVLSHFFYINFKHQLLSIFFFNAITLFQTIFLKLEVMTDLPILFGSSHRFLEVPHKGVLNK